MSLKYSGLLFSLIITLEAINGLALNNPSSAKSHTQELPAVHSIKEDEVTTESVKIIIRNTSEIIPKSNGSSDASNTASNKTIAPSSNSTIAITTTSSPLTPSLPATSFHVPSSPAIPSSSPAPPAPSPAPSPAPEKGNWVVYDATTKTTCIIASMYIQLNITYPGQNKEVNTVSVNVPKNASSNGICQELSQSLVINWVPGHYLQINFTSNKSANNFFISEVSLKVNATIFRDVKDSEKVWFFKNTSSEFTTPLEMSYKCSKTQNINLESGSPELKAVLILKDTQFEAFMNKSKAEFGAVQDCDTFDTPDIVPIAVGCALAILVLVVLVAYLIGRKHSQNQGYLSM